MILVDSSVWIDHLRREIPELSSLLLKEHALTHPFVIGEVAVGSLKNRKAVLKDMTDLPLVELAKDFEVLALIERNQLFGTGLGYVDCHLLASALMGGVDLWSNDKQLSKVAQSLGLSGQSG